MDIYETVSKFRPPAGGVVLSIGNFDGVHRGHRRLIEAARERGRESGAPIVVMTFDPHPLAVVAPQRAPARLSTTREKAALLDAAGVDALIVLRSDRALLGLTPGEFLDGAVKSCRPRAIVEGPTFNFGRGRGGSVDTLRECSARAGFAVIVVDELHCEDQPDRPAINSSAIRAALSNGRLGLANDMLGRPYRIVGVVGDGQRRGTELGFPTANLTDIPHLAPAPAVYAAIAQLEDGALHSAAVNIGAQPTFDQSEARVEAHLLDFVGDLRGRKIGLHLIAALREQRRFENGAELARQLRADVANTRELLAKTDHRRRVDLMPL